MKKLLLSALAICAFSFANAQEDEKSTEGNQTSKGSWLIEANTGFGSAHTADTGIRFTSRDGESIYNIGLEGGYFIMDNLAVKAGLGFGGNSATDSNRFSYKVGAKYYVMGMIPVSLDLNGASIKDASEDPMYLGVGAGYAWFLGKNVSVEPGVRYNATLNDDADPEGNFQVNIGFALHF